jgi:hypothetical protein
MEEKKSIRYRDEPTFDNYVSFGVKKILGVPTLSTFDNVSVK